MARITRITFSTFESLRNFDNGLFHALLEATKAEPDGRTVLVDSASIRGEAFQTRWKQWVERNPSLVLSKDSEQDERWAVEQEQARKAEHDAHIQKHADEAAARYFQYWVGQRGLRDTQRTRDAIFAEFEKREKRDGVIPSAAHLDVIIELFNTQGVLEWKPAEPVVPAAPPPPPPVVLSDGSHQRPLDASPSHSWTVAQLKDWDERQRAERARKIREGNNAVAAQFKSVPSLEVEI